MPVIVITGQRQFSGEVGVKTSPVSGVPLTVASGTWPNYALEVAGLTHGGLLNVRAGTVGLGVGSAIFAIDAGNGYVVLPPAYPLRATSANDAAWVLAQFSEEITLSTSGTTTDSSANLLPAGAIIEAVVARVTTTITTATAWTLGDASTAARFLGTQNGAQLTAGATAVGLAHVVSGGAALTQASAAKLRITTTGTPGAGKIRVTVFARVFTAPAS